MTAPLTFVEKLFVREFLFSRRSEVPFAAPFIPRRAPPVPATRLFSRNRHGASEPVSSDIREYDGVGTRGAMIAVALPTFE